MEFHRRASHNLSINWGQRDVQLYLDTFTGVPKAILCKACSSSDHVTNSCPLSPRSTDSSGPKRGDLCFNFNKGVPCAHTPCPYTHQCNKPGCTAAHPGKDHPDSSSSGPTQRLATEAIPPEAAIEYLSKLSSTTPIDLPQLALYFHDHPDHPSVDAVLNGLSQGFKIGFQGPPFISDINLTASVYRYFDASLAPATKRFYSVGQNHFISFCLMQGLISPSMPLLPASESTLIHFVSHLAKTVSYNTIKLYLFAFRDLHRKYNFPLKLPKMFRLQKVLNSIKRSQTPVKLDHYPITIQILQSIFNSYQPHLSCDLNHVMLWAAFTLAFFGFLRSSEFTCNDKVFDPATHLCLKDVTFVPNIEPPNYMLVLIKRCKTDPFCNGCTLTLARSTTSICAVMAMKDYVLQCQPSSAGPLFTFTSGKWLTRTSLTHKLHDILQQCGIQPQHFLA